MSGIDRSASDAKKRVVVGMSGGVDSSVAAYLLLKQGYDVVGLFMHNWDEQDGGACTSADDWADVRAVCGKLNIPHYSVNFADKYMDRVFKYFLAEYKAGRTPNPDVLCNREIKFGPFADYAQKLGADFIATGHYCGTLHVGGRTRLMRGADRSKDQSYFLNQVAERRLANVMFPLADIDKSEVRAIAEREGLVTARKKDSTGICFIGERKFREFLSHYLPARPGDITDLCGNVIGRHNGLMYYTLGQRRGLDIGGRAGYGQNRWYVVHKDLRQNALRVSCGEGEELFADSCEVSGMNIIGDLGECTQMRLTAKTRYRMPDVPVTVTLVGDRAHIAFDKPERAVTPGQYAVLYDGERCIGGGVIESVSPDPALWVKKQKNT